MFIEVLLIVSSQVYSLLYSNGMCDPLEIVALEMFTENEGSPLFVVPSELFALNNHITLF